MKAIILAAGKGSRLNKFTDGNPKCLLKLGKETVLSREVRLLKECGVSPTNIFVVGGYRYETLKDIAPNIIVNSYYNDKDNAYSLGLALEQVKGDNIIVMDADLCFEKELLEMVLNDNHDNLLLSKRSEDEEESTGIIVNEDGYATAIGKQYRHTGYVYLSIFKIAQHAVADFRTALLKERNEKTWYTMAMSEIIGRYPFFNKVTNLKWHEIDFVDDYYETLEMFCLGEN